MHVFLDASIDVGMLHCPLCFLSCHKLISSDNLCAKSAALALLFTDCTLKNSVLHCLLCHIWEVGHYCSDCAVAPSVQLSPYVFDRDTVFVILPLYCTPPQCVFNLTVVMLNHLKELDQFEDQKQTAHGPKHATSSVKHGGGML